VTTFAEQVASGALTSQFVPERRRLEGRIERLRTQHTEAVRDKSAAENKSRNPLERLSTMEKEREDLGCRLAEEKEDAEKTRAEAQDARTEAQAARKRAADMELELKNIRAHHEKTESFTRTGVERAHTLFVDAYHELGAQTTPFDESGEDVGLRFSWVVARRAGVAPVHRYCPYVLRVPHYLRGGCECLVPRGTQAFRSLRPGKRGLRSWSVLD
jgi:hypothetical protein